MLVKAMAGVLVLLVLGACDPQRIAQLEEAVSSEPDVRARFGEPEAIWIAPRRSIEGADALRPGELRKLHSGMIMYCQITNQRLLNEITIWLINETGQHRFDRPDRSREE